MAIIRIGTTMMIGTRECAIVYSEETRILHCKGYCPRYSIKKSWLF